MKKKSLETAIARNCTLLTSIETLRVIATHMPNTVCLVITYTDGLQVEYLCPLEGEHYLVVKEVETNTGCIVLYPECKPVQLTFTIQEPC